jgi:cell division protein FtsW
MNRRHIDYTLLLTTLLLVAIGVTMVYSSSAIFARERYGDTYFFLKRQLLSITIGFGALYAGRTIPIAIYRRFAYPILIVSVFLLILVQIPGLGITAGGATRWLHVAGINFQPSEFAKIALVIFMAYMLSKKQDQIKHFGFGFLPPMLTSLLLIFLVLLGKDLGNAVLMAVTVIALMFVAGARLTHLLALLLMALPAFYKLIASVSYRRQRILAFLDPWEHSRDAGFQIIQSYLAFQAGGILGAGLGQGRQKLFYLPEAHTDFIFSVLGEELGLWGVLLVLALFATWITRALIISWKTPDNYTRYLGLGITLMIGCLAILNMGVVMGLLPTKGIPLPFVSYGGTSLVMNLFAVGILLNISARNLTEEETCT